jgi:SAM-dependent methyltransferase
MKNITCPLTLQCNVKLLFEISTNEIVDLYGSVPVKHFFGEVPKLGVYQCLESKYMFFHPQIEQGDSEFYSSLQQSKNYYPTNRFEYAEALKYIKQTDEVLEIGAGDGFFLKILKDKNIVSQGLEINNCAIKNAKSQGLNVSDLRVEDLITAQKKFDVIVLFQVIEHIYDINAFIKSVLKCLKKEGILIVSVPNNDGFMLTTIRFNKYNLPPHHMGLWTERSLKYIAEIFNLKFIDCHNEHLQKENYDLFKIHLRLRFSAIHPQIGKLLLRMPESFWKGFFKAFSKYLNGHTCMAVYKIQ